MPPPTSGKRLTFLRFYQIDCESGCWLYTGYIRRDGYAGAVNLAGKRVSACRAFFETLKGQIPQGHDLDHLCGNRRCVNPNHLEPVTNHENRRRAGGIKLTEQNVRDVKRELLTDSSSPNIRAIAERFGVLPTNIYNILAGRNWKAVVA